MKTLLEAWIESVVRRPDEFAVRTSGGDLTYKALDRRSRILSKNLHKYRGLDAVVALSYGPGYFIALHACMRAGVTSLPMDLSLPDEMLRTQLSRLHYACIISDGAHLDRLGLSGDIVICTEAKEDNDPGDDMVKEREFGEGLIDLPLYRAFTSGSSGQQSLVTVDHRSFANYSNQDQEEVDLHAPMVVRCCVASHVSSMQIGTFWRSVTNGDTYVSIDPKAGGLSASAEQLLRIQPGILSGFPSLLGKVLDVVRQTGKLTGTHMLSITGEPLKPAWIRSYIDLMPSLETIAYAYSSTEAMLVASWQGSPREFLACQRIPAGYPVPDKEVLIVDENGLPVPDGEIGEIVVRSSFICSDIQGRDAALRLDQGDVDSVRTYRTRDLGRFMPNGMIECLGRLDRQCKINGVRIDPLIVEQCIESFAEVEGCVVSSVEQNGMSILVAAYLSRVELEVEQLRQYLSDLLPLSHQPSAWLRFESLPKTDRGKMALGEIDLMIRERLAVNGRLEGLPLQTPTEQALAGIWAELLNTKVSWRQSDFFNMGGHSLTVLQLIERIRSLWSLSIDISAVFMHSSLESMARFIDSKMADITAQVKTIPISPVKVWDTGHGAYVFAFVGGAGSEEEFTKYHLIGRVLGEAWRLYILPDPQTSKGRFPTIGLDELADQYAGILIPFSKHGKIWLLGDCIGGVDAFAVACALQTHGIQEIGLIHMDNELPSPRPKVPSNGLKGMDAYRQLPALTSPYQDRLFRIFLWLGRLNSLRYIFHVRPRSRRQVLDMAIEYGLFDPEDYARRCPDAGHCAETRFHHYLQSGWPNQEPPSNRFNAYRYAKQVPNFDIQSDEPLLHALLSGFDTRYPRRRVLAHMQRPNLKSDIMSARIDIRQNFLIRSAFKGDLHMLLSEDFPEDLGSIGWERHINGAVHIHRVTGDHRSYLKEHLAATASVIRRILEGEL
jgi:acyl-coenzyme A synthetase/AMP-(fatty) acid ligase/thioesterase domain-containing protein